jgi:hypothetical protein
VPNKMTPETLALLLRTSYGLRFEGFSWDGDVWLPGTGPRSAAFVQEQRKEAAVNMERNREVNHASDH